jgi:hypothetical protein
MTLIDYEIIYPLVGNGERQRMDRIRDHARQEIEGEDVRSMVFYVMSIASNASRAQKIYIFNRIVHLFHDLE